MSSKKLQIAPHQCLFDDGVSALDQTKKCFHLALRKNFHWSQCLHLRKFRLHPSGVAPKSPAISAQASESETMKCEGCQMAKAVVYVSESQAALCTGCSSMMGNVSRFHLCALCDRRPATTFCRQDNASLCSDCDLDIHLCNPVRHTRTPLEPISSEAVKVRRTIVCEETHALFA